MFECVYLTFVYSFADRVRFFLRDAARDRGVYGSIITLYGDAWYFRVAIHRHCAKCISN